MKKVGYIGIVLFLLIATFAQADSSGYFSMLEPLESIDMGEIYERFHSIFDFFMLLVLFSAIAQFALGKVYGEHTKGAAIVVSLLLAFAFSLFSSRTGFYLGQLGGLSIAVFAGFVLFFLFLLLKGMGARTGLTLSLLFIVSYAIIGALLPEWYQWINEKATETFGFALVNLLIYVALITSVVKIIIGLIQGKNLIDK